MDTVSRETCSRIMAAIKSRRTKPEMRLRSLLRERDLLGKDTRYNRVGDVCWPSRKIAIFLQGCFWHGCRTHYHEPKSNVEFWRKKIDGNMDRDRKQFRRLRKEGWRVAVLWEHDVKNEKAINSLIGKIS
jgi:DNA mismatch endonuclease (patch repair protein)